jgi:hypothetical protein
MKYAIAVLTLGLGASMNASATWCGSDEWGYPVGCHGIGMWDTYRTLREEADIYSIYQNYYSPNNSSNPVSATCNSSAEVRLAHALHDIAKWRSDNGPNWPIDHSGDSIVVVFDDGGSQWFYWDYWYVPAAPETYIEPKNLYAGAAGTADYPGNLQCPGTAENTSRLQNFPW